MKLGSISKFFSRLVVLMIIIYSAISFLPTKAAVSFVNSDITGDTGDTWGVAIGDLDGDGYNDIFVANRSNSQNNIWMNDGFANFTANDITGDLGNSYGAAIGDVDGDDDLDIYVSNAGGGQNKLWINSGSGTFTASDITGDTRNTQGAIFVDLDGDDDLDIYAPAWNQNNNIWMNDGAGNFTSNDIAGDASASIGAVAADFDGDGDNDIYVSNDNSVQNKLWMNDGSANFTANDISGDTLDAYTAATGDVDGDGDIDLYVPTNDPTQNNLWINDGSANFTAGHISGDTGSSRGAAMADFDGDGDLDIYAGESTQNILWINDGTGSFTQDVVDLSDVGNSYYVQFGDLDGDTDYDLYVGTSGQNKLWINEAPIYVAPVVGGGDSYAQPPSCVFSSSSLKVEPGESVKLNWSVEWLDSVQSMYYYKLSDNKPKVSEYEHIYSLETTGIEIKTIFETTEFQLDAINKWGATICTLEIIVEDNKTVPEIEDISAPEISEPEPVIIEDNQNGSADSDVCPQYLNEYINIKHQNNAEEVIKLESFLNIHEDENLSIDGVYSQTDFDAVVRFQEKYRAEVLDPWKLIKQGDQYIYVPDHKNGFLRLLSRGTGYVYISTQKQINHLYCRDIYVAPQLEIEATPEPEEIIEIEPENISASVGKSWFSRVIYSLLSGIFGG